MSQMLGLPCQALAVTGSDWLCAQSESVIRVKTRNNQSQESGKCVLFLSPSRDANGSSLPCLPGQSGLPLLLVTTVRVGQTTPERNRADNGPPHLP